MSRVTPASPPTPLVTIRVPVAMKERFDWMARVMNRPRNYVFVEALQRYLDQPVFHLDGHDVHARYCTRVQRGDGYAYALGRALFPLA